MPAKGSQPSRAWPAPTGSKGLDRGVIEQLEIALFDQSLLDGGLVHFVSMFFALFRLDAETGEHATAAS